MELKHINSHLPLEAFAESRKGGRSENQDSWDAADTPLGFVATVCDGMGGGPAGKTASTIAVRTIIRYCQEYDKKYQTITTEQNNPDTKCTKMENNETEEQTDRESILNNAETVPVSPGETKDNDITNMPAPEKILEKAVEKANHAIRIACIDNPKLRGMGSTCTILLITENQQAYIVHVGDSRVYQLRGHKKIFRTFDHSRVFELVKQKVITEEQARLSDQSNIITRALGVADEVVPDIERVSYKPGDRFLLCTDGIHGTMPETELIKKTTEKGSIGKIVDDIATSVDGEGREKGGGHDNLTLVLIQMNKKTIIKNIYESLFHR